ncbi:hypothetical protein TSAR_011542 [Trichomalopsis sarcophagae]|uniref:Uncharacterized protein n=1 Tax=Trichomalopsis sarcophagae TaxID=543379 RepID=A0A232FIJ3_9HYME|nr:hypothetical protein TSAR_011542 [Trichomalopsis sarcophagae]
MYKSALLCLLLVSLAHGSIFEKFENYTRIFGFTPDESSNELWRGIIRDCSKKVSFSCIQKNAYSFLDRTFIDRDNITVFEGLSLTRNNLDYDTCSKDACTKDNLVEESNEDKKSRTEDEEEEEYLTPLEEVTYALRKKTFKFLATRDYEIQLPRFIAGGASLKISPREIDDSGALIRVDFGNRAVEEQQHGRLFFKKIKKQIQNKLLMALLILILVIKIIKVKFMFIIPFLFGVGTAKKLFLKLLLFLVPAFGHVFKLCSSYYSSTKYHQHHHKIIHHHEHVPVPVPVAKPVYYDHPPSHSHGSSPPYVLDEDFNGYDYAHPHIQYRKDIEELKEWGIEPYDESYDQNGPQAGVIYQGPPGPTTPSGPKSGPPKFPFGVPPQFMANPKPMGPGGFMDKVQLPPHHPQNLAYSGYRPPLPPPPPSNNRPPAVPAASLPVGVVAAPFFGPPKPSIKSPPGLGGTGGDGGGAFSTAQGSYSKPVYQTQQRNELQQQASAPAPAPAVPVAMPPTRKPYDDQFYGPIVERLDDIFNQMRFVEEPCRERLVCSMYKNPTLYSPNSNIVSNELSRDPQELQQGNTASASSQRFYRYLNAARTGQDGGDCLRSYHCSINTE